MTADILLIIAALVSAAFMLKKKLNIGLVMTVEAVFIALITGMQAKAFFSSAAGAVFSVSTFRLIIAFFLIMMLENILRTSGMFKRMVDSLKEIAGSNRTAAGLLPVVAGLLPSPGGARFSCPMVEEAILDNSSDADKTYINYWFRHIWMDGFMLYPGIILAAELLGTDVFSMFAKLLPFILFTVVVGYFTGLRKIKKEKIVKEKAAGTNLRILFISSLPLTSVILLYILLMRITPYALEASLLSILIVLMILKRFGIGRIFKTIRDSFPVKLVFVIFGVMIFRAALFDSGLLAGLPSVLESAGIPVFLVYLALPFLTGAATGICVSSISISFPVLLALGLADNPWYGVLAFVSGYIGMMVTPVHLCMVVSSEYFRHPAASVAKRVAIAEIPLFIIVSALMTYIYLI